MATNKEIRIPFTVGGRNFEAVCPPCGGKLRDNCEEMLRRTDGENGGAIGDEDEMVFSGHCTELPKKLRRYLLVTNRRRPDLPRHVLCIYWSGAEVGWYQFWLSMGDRWRDNYLVVRRCA